MEDNIRVISTEEELKIFSDPYRLKIINVFQDNEKPLTVKGCADIMGEVPAKVYYHVKKLLKIEILELDHIEVINGINAKYYKLIKRRFTIKLDNQNQQEMYSSLNHVQNFVVNLVDDFKKDMIKSTQDAVDNNELDETEVGMLTGNHIYLNEEEYKQVTELLIEINENHNKKDKTKKKYNFISGLSRKKEWYLIIPFYISKVCCW